MWTIRIIGTIRITGTIRMTSATAAAAVTTAVAAHPTRAARLNREQTYPRTHRLVYPTPTASILKLRHIFPRRCRRNRRRRRRRQLTVPPPPPTWDWRRSSARRILRVLRQGLPSHRDCASSSTDFFRLKNQRVGYTFWTVSVEHVHSPHLRFPLTPLKGFKLRNDRRAVYTVGRTLVVYRYTV